MFPCPLTAKPLFSRLCGVSHVAFMGDCPCKRPSAGRERPFRGPSGAGSGRFRGVRAKNRKQRLDRDARRSGDEIETRGQRPSGPGQRRALASDPKGDRDRLAAQFTKTHHRSRSLPPARRGRCSRGANAVSAGQGGRRIEAETPGTGKPRMPAGTKFLETAFAGISSFREFLDDRAARRLAAPALGGRFSMCFCHRGRSLRQRAGAGSFRMRSRPLSAGSGRQGCGPSTRHKPPFGTKWRDLSAWTARASLGANRRKVPPNHPSKIEKGASAPLFSKVSKVSAREFH